MTALRTAALAVGLLLLAVSNAAALNRTTSLVSKPTGVADPNTDVVTVRAISQDGSRVFFTTAQKMTADDNDTNRIDIYERSGGTTKLISKPTGVADPNSGDANIGGSTPEPSVSADGSRVFFVTTQKMTADDNDTNRLDVYERSGGTTKLVSKPTGVADPDTADADLSIRVSQDGSRVFFQTPEKLTSDDNDTGRLDVYERSGGTTKLVSKPTGVADPDTDEATLGAVSQDGSRAFFNTTQKLTADDFDTNRFDAYERSGGTTKLVSKATGIDPDSSGAFFAATSADGSRVFFATPQALTADDNDTNRDDVYERSGGTTKLVSKATGIADPDTGGADFSGISQDGSRVFFLTAQKLTADDNDTARFDIYERSAGTTKLVSQPTGVADPDTADATFGGISQDGSHAFFVTTQKLTADDQDTNRFDVYERSGGTTKLVSKPTGVTDPDTDVAFFSGASQDGSRVFFSSTQKLTPEDNDTNRDDVYERSAGTTRLISRPAGVPDPNTADAFLRRVSQDGSRVFFDTSQKLTADDNDTNRTDVYAALPPPAAATLAATGVNARTATLRGVVNPNGLATSYRFELGETTAYGTLTPPAGTGSVDGPTAVARPVTGLKPNRTYHFRVRATNASGTALGADKTFKTSPARPRKANLAGVKKTIRVKRNRRFKVTFRATRGLRGNARFRGAGRTLARKSFKVGRSGRVRLTLRLSRKNFRLLKRRRSIKTKLIVTLRNSAGLTSKASKRVTLKAPKRRHK
jgi:hypothetical protein